MGGSDSYVRSSNGVGVSRSLHKKSEVKSRFWDLQVVLMLLALTVAVASAMVIGDGDSTEISTGTNVDKAANDTPSEVPKLPPFIGFELLQHIRWNCGYVKPISNISLELVMGRWYLVEIISPSSEKRQDSCAGVDFWRWNDQENNMMPDVVPPPLVRPEHLVMRGFNRRVNEQHTSSYRVDTTTIVPGSHGAIWDQPTMGATVAVLDFTPDARFITVITCIRATGFEWTSVMGREPNGTALQRDQLHERLRATGLRYVDNSKLQNNSACTYR